MRFAIRTRCLPVVSALIFSVGQSALAAEVSGVRLEDQVVVGHQSLQLNGAGTRYKLVFKVYVSGLYLAARKSSAAEVFAAAGPKRVSISMLRDVGNEEFGRSFMAGIRQNTDKADKVRITPQLLKFGELFASIPELKKGDLLTIDWVPARGMQLQLNGKKIADTYPDVTFFNAILKIWLGENPADAMLKRLMLGEKIEDGQRPGGH